MYLFHLFRSFLPFRNPIGFGASDFVEIAAAALLVLLAITRIGSEAVLRRFAGRTATCMAVLAILPVGMRLLLLAHCAAPAPSGSDDFSYALLGDTLAHLRLANPPHALPQFFETIFVLQQPSYSSIYPLGQGIILAFGQLLFGGQWAGVLFSVGLLCALCYWMLRGWTTPLWALAGGLLAVSEFGPLSAWMNSYWGGALAGVAGCLVFGALPRLREGGGARHAALLGIGLGLEVLTRPFEAILLVVCAALFFPLAGQPGWAWSTLENNSADLPKPRRSASPGGYLGERSKVMDHRRVAKLFGVSLLALTPALLLSLAQNRAVTGRWTTLPYMLSREQYGVPTSFTPQPNPVPHRSLTPSQELDYRAQSAIHGEGTDTPGRFLRRLAFRLRYWRFFFFAPLYLAALMFLVSPAVRRRLVNRDKNSPSARAGAAGSLLRRAGELRSAWVLIAFAIFFLGTNFYPYFYPHYVAAVTCLCVLVSVKGLEWIARMEVRGLAVGRQASRLILFVCAAQFFFWYGLHLFGSEDVWPLLRYETWDFINYGDPQGRVAVGDRLAAVSGPQLVFVRYWPRHKFQEWVHNAADIDGSQVVWANDLGSAENQKLLDYFPKRKAWLLEPDAGPPRLTRYPGAALTLHQ